MFVCDEVKVKEELKSEVEEKFITNVSQVNKEVQFNKEVSQVNEEVSLVVVEKRNNEVVGEKFNKKTNKVGEVMSNEERSIKEVIKVRNSSEIVSLFECVHKSGLPNFQGCKIRVGVQFNMKMWRERLEDYEDKVVCEFLEFGFPLDVDRSKQLCYDVRKNHKGARDHPKFIRDYFKRECEESRIAGPFPKNPLSIPLVVSPMNTVPKRNSVDERRVIVDLSWPVGSAVNEGISKDIYLGELIELHYASVEEVCRMVLEMGKGSVIYKRDLRHAYRQFPIDPRDIRYLGYFWENQFYIDLVLAMGQRNAGMACTRVTKSIMYMHAQDGHRGTNYLDDLIGVSPPHKGTEAYESLGRLLSDLGLRENFPKACGPSTSQIVLGILIDTVAGTMSVPPEKMSEVFLVLDQWRTKRKSDRVELQSLLGTLQWVTRCVRQSRVFLNRMLETLRSMSGAPNVTLTESFRKDLRWWDLFMERYNGVSFFPATSWDEPDVTFSTDSCLTGCGGICGHEYFHSQFPEFILRRNLPIHALEMLAVLVAVRFWGSKCESGKIQIFCDNESVVHVINSNRTKDDFLSTCLRELWLEVSSHGFELRAVHLPGEENRVADWLSRWDRDLAYQTAFWEFTEGDTGVYRELKVTDELFEFSSDL